jgi:hypothetical protein
MEFVMEEKTYSSWKKLKISDRVKRVLEYLESDGVTPSDELIENAIMFDAGKLSEVDFDTHVKWAILVSEFKEKGIYI